MHTVIVTAIADFTYRGQHVRAGEPLEMRPIEALAASRKHQVTLDAAKNRTILSRDLTAEPETDAPAPQRRRRTYQRRDLQADP